MRKALLIAGAAALVAGAPALAKPGGGGGGGGKPEKHQGGGGDGGHGGGGKPHKMERGGGGGHDRVEHRGGGGGGGGRALREDRGPERAFAREQRRAERTFARQERRGDLAKPAKADKKGWARAEAKRDRNFAKAERKALKAEQKRFERAPEVRSVRYEDRRLDRSRDRYEERAFADRGFAGTCPPGLARKGNGCLPPGQAKKMFALGSVFPVAYYSGYNVPDEYRAWYGDNPDSFYRYDESGSIYRVDRGSGLIESIIPLLGGGFGLGQVLPAGYDAYNLPLSYRDDYVDSQDAWYRYGDDAIYQVDPQSQLIEGIVALLGGDLNVGQMLPSGYDAYNLPMEYRDDYVDDADSMYRYADGNIYQIDPQSMIIQQIVAQLT